MTREPQMLISRSVSVEFLFVITVLLYVSPEQTFTVGKIIYFRKIIELKAS